jgi:hypothetical protein
MVDDLGLRSSGSSPPARTMTDRVLQEAKRLEAGAEPRRIGPGSETPHRAPTPSKGKWQPDTAVHLADTGPPPDRSHRGPRDPDARRAPDPLECTQMARMFTATVHDGAIADKHLASLPDGARVTVVIVEDDQGELDETIERELEARIVEADRGDSFVEASEVLRRLDARRSRS